MWWLTRLAILLVGAGLGLSAYVQINDPDALQWMAFYSLPAVLSVAYSAAANPHKFKVLQVLLLGSAVFTSVMMVGVVSSGAGLGLTSELGRELAGCGLTSLWTSTLFMHSIRFVGDRAIASNLLTMAALSAYYTYLVRYTDLQLEGHCSGALPTI